MAETTVVVPRIECRGFRQAYGGSPILKCVDMAVPPGKTLAILGKSGSGKSTLLRSLCLLEALSDGEAFLDGQQYIARGEGLFQGWEVRRQIAMVFQEYNLFPHMTCLRNITLPLERVGRLHPKKALDVAEAMANRLGISAILGRYPEEVSHGQAQRLALARAMVMKPRVLLLDEVTSALDPESVFSVVDALRHVRDFDLDGGLAIIIVTHHLQFAIEFADEIAFFADGRIIEQLPAHEFLQNCRCPQTREFVSRYASIM